MRIAMAVVLLAALGAASAAYGQATGDMSLESTKGTYYEGDVVIIYGQVYTILPNAPEVTLKISRGGAIIEIAQLEVAKDGKFAHTAIADGRLWKESGEYTAEASYGDRARQAAKFGFVRDSEKSFSKGAFEVDAGNAGTFDVAYSAALANVTDMWVDSGNLALVVELEAGKRPGELTVELPREYVDAKRPDGSDEAFIVTIDGAQTAHKESASDSSRSITVALAPGSSEARFIGTKAVPEFGAAAALAMAAAVAAAIVLQARRPGLKPVL